MDKFELRDRKVKLERLETFKEGEKLIYEWVKSGVISFREFSALCEYNRIISGME